MVSEVASKGPPSRTVMAPHNDRNVLARSNLPRKALKNVTPARIRPSLQRGIMQAVEAIVEELKEKNLKKGRIARRSLKSQPFRQTGIQRVVDIIATQLDKVAKDGTRLTVLNRSQGNENHTRSGGGYAIRYN